MYKLSRFGDVDFTGYFADRPTTSVGTMRLAPKYANTAAGAMFTGPYLNRQSINPLGTFLGSPVADYMYQQFPEPQVNKLVYEEDLSADSAAAFVTMWNNHAELRGMWEKLYRTDKNDDDQWIYAQLVELPHIIRSRGLTQTIRMAFETLEHSWRGDAFEYSDTISAGSYDTAALSGVGNVINDDLTLVLTANGGTVTRIEACAESMVASPATRSMWSWQYDGTLTAGQSVTINAKKATVIHSANGSDYANLTYTQQTVSGSTMVHNIPIFFYADGHLLNGISANPINNWYIKPTGASLDVYVWGWERYA